MAFKLQFETSWRKTSLCIHISSLSLSIACLSPPLLGFGIGKSVKPVLIVLLCLENLLRTSIVVSPTIINHINNKLETYTCIPLFYLKYFPGMWMGECVASNHIVTARAAMARVITNLRGAKM